MNSNYPFKHDIIYSASRTSHNRVWSNTGRLIEKAQKKISDIKQNLHNGGHPLYELPDGKEDLIEIEKSAHYIRDNFAHVVILGTGGASLGARALLSLKNCKNTLTLVISKSGNTIDTLSQTLIMIKHFLGHMGKEALSRHFFFLTQPEDSLLRRLASEYGITVMDHIPELGGRFSVLSNVGLLPAAISGLNIHDIREGAQKVMNYTLNNSDIMNIPSVVGASFIVGADANQNKSINVMMPYVNRLQKFTDWYVQLWAESLGKQGRGTTPLAALGPRDQHSQLQMFLDGKKDKSFTFITVQKKQSGVRIDTSLFDAPEISHLHGKDLADVVDAFYQGTLQSILDTKIPCQTITLEDLNEYSMGALMMHFMLETLFAAAMLGVNAFDQPRVEAGKKYAEQTLSE